MYQGGAPLERFTSISVVMDRDAEPVAEASKPAGWWRRTQQIYVHMQELNELLAAARSELQDSRKKIKSIETVLAGKKELQKQLLTYWQTKKIRQEYKGLMTAKAKAEYAQAHEREFKLSNAAAKYFKNHGITKLPSTKALQAEIQHLISEKDVLYNDYREKQRRAKELETVKSNLETVLGRKEKHYELIPS